MKKQVFSNAINSSRRVTYIAHGGAQRFEAFIQWLLELKSQEISPENHYYFSLFAFDGLSIDHASNALKQKPYHIKDEAFLSWQSKAGRFHRLSLSAMTIKLYGQLNLTVMSTFEIKHLELAYAKFSGYKNPIQNFISDQMLWFALNFSGLMFEHLSGSIPMAALPDSAYVRLSTLRRLFTSQDEGQVEGFDQALMQTISGYLEPMGADKNPIFVNELVSACRRRKGVSNAIAKGEMLRECLILSASAGQYGPISSLILGWAISLIVHGTRNLQNLSQAAIANYVSVTSLKLFHGLRGRDIQLFSTEDFVDEYKKIIELVTDGQKQIASSALASFHHFIEEWLDAPIIQRKLYINDSESIPKANIIWPHETALILEWLNHAACDKRLVQFWKVAILISSESRIRIGELISVTCKDVNFYPDQIEIKITGQKSKAAKRTLFIQNPNTILAITELWQKRGLERALPSDYLFGDPANPKRIYQLGRFYFGLNQFLKSVTGDRRVSFHTTSHSVISNQLEKIIEGGGIERINPLSQFATDVGHYSVITSYREYMHTYEASLRRSLDRALTKIKVSSAIAERWSQTKAATIRKRVSTHHLVAQNHYWETMLKSKNCEGLLSVPGLHETEQAIPPDFLFGCSTIRFQNVLFALSDLVVGIDIESVASRHGVSRNQLGEMILITRDIAFRNKIAHNIKFDTTELGTIQCLKQFKTFGIDFKKATQATYSATFNFLSLPKTVNDSSLKMGIRSWLDCFKKSSSGYIALREDASTLNLLKLLKQSGLDITNLCIFVASNQTPQPKYLEDAIRKLFIATFSISPPVFSIDKRNGRPDVYLGVTKDRVLTDIVPHSSATSVIGLNGLLFAAAVWLEVAQ